MVDLDRIARFGTTVSRWLHRDARTGEAVDELVEACEHAGDLAMLAVALGLRSDRAFSDSAAPSAATDLAKAVVLLEASDGGELERISAHTACGIAFANRSMFELAADQYGAALALGAKETPGSIDFLLAPVAFNLVELEVQWAAMLRQLGDHEGVLERLHAWESVNAALSYYELPRPWRMEVDALGLLLGSIAGLDRQREAETLLGGVLEEIGEESRAVGLSLLAIALAKRDTGATDALDAAERAVQAIDPDTHPQIHDLALFVAADAEASLGYGRGLRYARRELAQRWSSRLESVVAMRAAIEAERLGQEREILSAHALRDDLTGIANRRGLDRYLHDLVAHDVHQVALIMFDIDGFKKVNDQHGHLTGDAVLIEIANALSAGVRSSDLVVRLGGDEFAVVLAQMDLPLAIDRAKALVTDIARRNVGEGEAVEIAVSAGVAAGDPAQLTELWAEADAAMYRAKAGLGIELAPSRVAFQQQPPA
jgi:diguanylate cyclase (GGDEF)-like protein